MGSSGRGVWTLFYYLGSSDSLSPTICLINSDVRTLFDYFGSSGTSVRAFFDYLGSPDRGVGSPFNYLGSSENLILAICLRNSGVWAPFDHLGLSRRSFWTNSNYLSSSERSVWAFLNYLGSSDSLGSSSDWGRGVCVKRIIVNDFTGPLCRIVLTLFDHSCPSDTWSTATSSRSGSFDNLSAATCCRHCWGFCVDYFARSNRLCRPIGCVNNLSGPPGKSVKTLSNHLGSSDWLGNCTYRRVQQREFTSCRRFHNVLTLYAIEVLQRCSRDRITIRDHGMARNFPRELPSRYDLPLV